MDYGLITFSSTHGAICAQKTLEPVTAARVMPVLREISLGCGMGPAVPAGGSGGGAAGPGSVGTKAGRVRVLRHNRKRPRP